MLKNTDLRVGNYFSYKGDVFEVNIIEADAVVGTSRANGGRGTFPYTDIDGVPFSRGILEAHGWAGVPAKGNNYYAFTGKSPVKLGGIAGLLDIEFPYDNGPMARVWTFQDRTKEYDPGTATMLQYFHELQNLIFGLLVVELVDLQ